MILIVDHCVSDIIICCHKNSFISQNDCLFLFKQIQNDGVFLLKQTLTFYEYLFPRILGSQSDQCDAGRLRGQER